MIHRHCAPFESGLVAIALKMGFDKYRDNLDHRFFKHYDLHKSYSVTGARTAPCSDSHAHISSNEVLDRSMENSPRERMWSRNRPRERIASPS
jgi:hypothetical protein